MIIDSYIDQIVNVVRFQDDTVARKQIALILQAFAESVEDNYGIRIADRKVTYDTIASPNRIKR